LKKKPKLLNQKPPIGFPIGNEKVGNKIEKSTKIDRTSS